MTEIRHASGYVNLFIYRLKPGVECSESEIKEFCKGKVQMNFNFNGNFKVIYVHAFV